MANSKTNVEVVLGFKANTDQAQKAIRELNKSLDAIQNKNLESLGINTELREAANAAKILQQNLQAATNVDTGKINIAQFSKGLKEANISIRELGDKLTGAGTAGQQAFLNLSRAITQMDVPLRQTNATLNNMLTTLKNTVKWELSSNLVHGIESAFSSAISYARNLNTSLTDIRVVSGQSVEQMAKFAVEANNAAKALGTTTKSYADAALIYYQQGDSAELAAKKAEITLKATNAAFSATAQEMSQLLTATWNSYQAGTDELEHMVDVMANLGAHTATSLEEIATSLQKVAATANTVGVSMEQMSAMISTVSSVTRQAPQVIGTAMNTILSRIGGLKLGETLEDGLNLNKYSQALQKIGVNVLDATGQLRDMGKIVDEIGDKWANLSRGEQSAVAQVIGGTRQYTTMMALFSNWDKYQQNFELTQNSEGALEEMQQTRLEGWEAASKRMQASLETIFQDLINDQGMISLINSLTKVIDQIENVIKSFGGLQGILVQVGTIAAQVFSKNIIDGAIKGATSIKTFAGTIKSSFADSGIKGVLQTLSMTKEQRQYMQTSQDAKLALAISKDDYANDTKFVAQAENAQILLEKKQQLIALESQLSTEQKRNYEVALASLQAENAEVDKSIEKHREQQQIFKNFVTENYTSGSAQKQVRQNMALTEEDYQREVTGVIQDLNSKGINVENIQDIINEYTKLYLSQSKIINMQTQIEDAFNHTDNIDQFKNSVGEILDKVDNAHFENNAINQVTQEIREAINSGDIDTAKDKLALLLEELKRLEETNTGKSDILGGAIGRIGFDINPLIDQLELLAKTSEEADEKNRQLRKGFEEFDVSTSSVTKGLQGLSQFGLSAVRSINSLQNVIGNWDTSNGVSKISGLAMALTGLISVASAAKTALVSLQMSATFASVIGIALAAVVGTYGILQGIQANEQKKLEEKAEASKKEFDRITQENTEITNLNQSYHELQQQYRTNDSVQQDLIKTTNKLAEAYGLVGLSVNATKEQIEDYNKLIAGKQIESIIKQARVEAEAAQEHISDTLNLNNDKINQSYGNITQKSQTYIAPITEEVTENVPLEDFFNWIAGSFSGLQGQDDTIGKEFARYVAKNYFGSSFDVTDGMFGEKRKTSSPESLKYYDNLRLALILGGAHAESAATMGGYDTKDLYKLWEQFVQGNSYAQWQSSQQAMGEYLYGENYSFNPSTFNPIRTRQIQKGQTYTEIIDESEKIKSFFGNTLPQKYNFIFNESGGLKTFHQFDNIAEQAQAIVLYQDLYTDLRNKRSEITEQINHTPLDDKEVINGLNSQKELINDVLNYLNIFIGEDGIVEEAQSFLENENLLGIVDSTAYKEMANLSADASLSEVSENYNAITELVKELANSGNYFIEELNGVTEEADPDKFNTIIKQIVNKIFHNESNAAEQVDLMNYIQDIYGQYGENLLTILNETEDIKSIDEFKESYDENTLQAELARGIPAEAALQKAQEYQTIKTNMDKTISNYNRFNRISSLVKDDMTEEDIQKIMDEYAGTGFELSEFLGFKTAKGKKEYLKSLDTNSIPDIISNLEDLIRIREDEIKDISENGTDEEKEKLEILQAQVTTLTNLKDIYTELNNQSQSITKQYELVKKGLSGDLTDEQGLKLFEAYGLNREDYQTPEAMAQWFLDNKESFQPPSLEGSEDWNKGQWADYYTQLQLYKEVQEQIASILTDSSIKKANQASNAISALNSELSNLAQGKGLSKKTQNILILAGIDPDSINSLDGAREQLQKLQNNVDNAQVEFSKKYKEIYGIDINPFDLNEEQLNELQNNPENAALYEAYKQWQQMLETFALASEAIMNTYTTQMQQEVNALEKRLSAIKKQANSLKEQATALSGAVSTGELTAQQKTLFSEDELEQWQKLQTSTDRANMATKYWSNYIIEEERAFTEQQKIFDQVDFYLTQLSKKYQENLSDEFNKEIFDNIVNSLEDTLAGAKIKEAFEKAFALNPKYFTGDWETAFNAIKQQIGEMDEETKKTFEQIEATGIDAMRNIWKEEGKAHADAALDAISKWENAFTTIANLRKKILGGEDISEDVFGDYKTFNKALEAYLANNEGKTVNDFVARVKSGGQMNLSLPGLQLSSLIPEDILNEFLKSNNLDYDTVTQILTEYLPKDAKIDDFISEYLQIIYSEFTELSPEKISEEIAKYLAGTNNTSINDFLSNLWINTQAYEAGKNALQERQETEADAQNRIEQAENAIDINNSKMSENSVLSDIFYALAENYGDKTIFDILQGTGKSESQVAESIGMSVQGFEQLDRDKFLEYGRYFNQQNEESLDNNIEQIEAKIAALNELKEYFDTNEWKFPEQYSTQLREYQEQLDEATAAQQNNKDANFNKYLTQMGKIVGKTAKEMQDYTEELVRNGEIADTDAYTQTRAAMAIARQSRGFENAHKNLKSYIKELNKYRKAMDSSTVDAKRYTKALDDVRDIYADIFDLDPKVAKKLGREFLDSAENARLLEKAINGDVEAYDRLQAAAAKNIIKNSNLGLADEFQAEIDRIVDIIASYDFDANGVKIGAEIRPEDMAKFGVDLNNMMFSTQEAAQAMTDALSAVGIDAEVEEVDLGSDPAEGINEYIGDVPLIAFDGLGGVQVLSTPVSSSWADEYSGTDKKAYILKGKNGKGVTRGATTSGRGGGGKQSGGGGGKAKTKKVEAWKQPKEEKERYHEIRDQLDAQSKVLDKIDKLKERAFGKHHLDQINAEINALQKDLQLQEQYYREASKYYTANLQKLKDAGAKFNEDGTVQYEEFMDRIIHEYNQAVEAFNWSDQTALDELKLEQAKARYEDLTKLLEEYEEDLDLISEIQTQIIEEQNKISAAALEGIQYKIEVKLDLSERDIAMIEYFQDKWEELLSMQDERMLKMTKQVQIYETNLTALGQSVRELQAKYNEGVLTEADYAEGMKDINDKILEQLENIQDVKKSLEELYGETLELASDKMEKYTSIMEHSRDVMENYIAMSELMGRGADYAGLEQVYQMQYDSSVANVEAAKMYLDTLKESRDEIERQVAENGWTDILQQQWYDVTEAITDGENDLLDKTQQALEDAQSMFENTMQKIIASFDDVLFNMKNGLSQLEDDYNYYNEQQERYLSTSKELYEVAKLNRQIDESIQDATTKTSKERLKALQEVINKQSESTRLTEYDVEMLQLQYKHALALQALEEAKNAKSTVRLTRDENGNYGYQYTADDNEIDDARQKVDDALQEINELAANRAAEIEQQVIETERQYRDELLAIAQDTTLTLEERQAKMEELTRRHNETLQFYNEQYTNATNALLTNQEYVYQRYGVSIMENTGMVQDQMNATVKAMIDKTSDYASYLEEQMSPGGQIYEALAKYKQDMGIVEGASGLTWSDMTGSIDQYRDANEKAKESIADVNTVLQQTLEGVADVTEQWDKHIKSLEAVIDLYEKLGQSAADAVARVADVEGLYGTAIGGRAGINSQAGITGLTTKQQWQYTWGPSNGLFGVHSAYDSEAAALAGAKEDIQAQFQNLIHEGEDDAETEQVRRQAEAWMNEAMKTIKVTSYLSGGLADYTGPAWLDGSKSAPELVLNSRDTANLLSAVDIVRAIDEETLRQISSMMKYSAISAVMGAGSGLSAGGVNPFAQTLDQNVHIEADFPNVTDKNEIIEAFDDLVNLASQYASRG